MNKEEKKTKQKIKRRKASITEAVATYNEGE